MNWFRRNVLWNLTGLTIPLLAAVFACPVLLRELGETRFGLLALAWTVLGYFGIFDLGLGRALTKAAAEKLASGKEKEIPEDLWGSSLLLLLLGIFGGLLISWLAPLGVRRFLNLPADLTNEVRRSVDILAVSLPFVTLAGGFRGLLEAYQRFGTVSSLRAVWGTFQFVGPAFVALHTKSIPDILLVLALGRVLTCLMTFVGCLSLLPRSRRLPSATATNLRELLHYGGWITVSSVVSPVMVYFDRFVIGSLVSLGAVGYFTTAFEVISKVLVVPTAVATTLFPVFSGASADTLHGARQMYRRGLRLIAISVLPIIVAVVALSSTLLRVWMGPEFARQATSVLQILAFGMLVNGLAHIPFVYLQATGRPDLTAKTHCLEIIPYLISLFWLTTSYGIVGTALAWTIRALADLVALHVLARRKMSADRHGGFSDDFALAVARSRLD